MFMSSADAKLAARDLQGCFIQGDHIAYLVVFRLDVPRPRLATHGELDINRISVLISVRVPEKLKDGHVILCYLL